MLCRPLAVVLSVVLVSSCAAPRTAMIAGTLTAAVGGVLLYRASQPGETHGSEVLFDFKGIDQAVNAILLTTLGVGILLSGAIGWGNEREAAARAAGRPLPGAPGTAATLLDARIEQLTAALDVELRAGHCATAASIGDRLAVLGRPVDFACPAGPAGR